MKKRSRKKFLIFIFVILVLFLISIAIFSKEKFVDGVSKKTILIGSSSALSGYTGFLGDETNKGARAYIEEINLKGGINGRKIKLISYDDQYEPKKTIENTHKLVQEDGVFSLFNYVGTPTSLSISAFVSAYEIPIIGLFTGSEYLREPVQKQIFNVRASYNQEVEEAISYFVDELGMTDIGVVYQRDSFGLSVFEAVKDSLEDRNLNVKFYTDFERGREFLLDEVKLTKEKNLDVVILVGTYTPIANFIKDSHDLNFDPYFYTVSFVGASKFSKELFDRKIDEEQYDKIIVTQVVPSPYSCNLPLVLEYRGLMTKYYPSEEFSYSSLEGFINAKILVLALEKMGENLTRENLVKTMESMNFEDIGLMNKVSYSDLDHQAFDEVYLTRLTGSRIFEEF